VPIRTLTPSAWPNSSFTAGNALTLTDSTLPLRASRLRKRLAAIPGSTSCASAASTTSTVTVPASTIVARRLFTSVRLEGGLAVARLGRGVVSAAVRVLVTGASGFVGSSTCTELVRRGHDVAALVRRPGSQPPDTTAVAGDLLDGDRLVAAVSEASPECVVHLAAEIATQRDADRITEVNVNGTKRLLDACELGGVRRVVFASSVVTGDGHGRVLEETAELPVETAYGASKQAGEQLLATASLEGVVVRPSHIYGPGGWFATEIVARLRGPGRFAVIGRGDKLVGHGPRRRRSRGARRRRRARAGG